MRLCISVLVIIALGSACAASETFRDVPEDHWAAESVGIVAQAGIMQGYPDSSFGGEKTVTRYELAAALANFIECLKETEKPLVRSEAELSLNAPKHWGEQSMDLLRIGGFIAEDSPLLRDGQAVVTQDDLARALASVGAQIIALRVPVADESE